MELSGEIVYNAFLSGFIRVKNQKNILNKINVFPVPDGDTGTNLVSTLNSIVEDTNVQFSIRDTVDSMANAALIGARGNSGIIFAQFINGINEEIKNTEVLNTETFAEIVNRAVPYAYRAILNPIEGTMITVIREWAESIYLLKDTNKNFKEIIIKSLDEARRSLSDTPKLLEVLKQSSVVDSGASGFVHFLEGIVDFFNDKDIIRFNEIIEKIEIEDDHYNLNVDVSNRYCTEALITNVEFDYDNIKDKIKHLGDSLIVAGNSSKVRIHIHTNNPDNLFSILKTVGTIVQQKVDDMQKQFQVVHKRLHKTAILTDSIADLPDNLIDKYQIHVIPMNLTIDGNAYLDKLTIKPDKFYSLIDGLKEYPTSSQPTQKSVENIFSFLTTHYDSIISINVSKEMSGTFQVVQKAAEKFIAKGKRITVINSKLNSGAEGLLVLQAARELEKGRTYDEVITILEEAIKKARIYVSVNTFKYMVKGGRVSNINGFIGTMINLKPIISIDKNGRGIAFDKSFSSKTSTKKILKIVKETNIKNKILSYSIVHANAPEKAEEYSLKLKEILGQPPEFVSEISPVVGINAGIGSVAVAFIAN